MARVGLLIAVLCAALFATSDVASARECAIYYANVTCDGQCFILDWSYKDDCGTPTFTIERRCCPSGTWHVIAEGVEGTTYEDCPAVGCISDQYSYRVSIECTPPCYCTGPMCSTVTPCTDCD